jgi:hypothetical protein
VSSVGKRPKRFTPEWIDSRVFVDTSTGCWLWRKRLNPDGYACDGQFFGHKTFYSHFVGDPNGLHVLHKCDVRCCVNPQHLFLGTHQDNMRDMVRKGRQASGDRSGSRTKPEAFPRGERHPHAKLNAEMVRVIRHEVAGGTSMRMLAKRFSVSAKQVSEVARNKVWKHVI